MRYHASKNITEFGYIMLGFASGTENMDNVIALLDVSRHIDYHLIFNSHSKTPENMFQFFTTAEQLI